MPQKKQSSGYATKTAARGRDFFSRRLRIGGGCFLIAALAVIAYWPSLGGGFIWDDDEVLTQNPLVQSAHGLHGMWLTKETIDYWPVTYTSFWLEWRLWGAHATGYRVVNVLLHVAACLLIWRILSKLEIPGAFLAAMLFAVHPVNVESVAWIAERKNTLALVFFLLSILSYLKNEFRDPLARASIHSLTGWYWLSLFAFLLAMLSKGSVAIGPVVLLLIVWWRNRRIVLADCLRTLPFFLIAGALSAVNIWFQTHGTDIVIRSAGIAERTAGTGAIVWFYLSKALLPIDLLFVYPRWEIHTTDWRWWAPLAAAAAASLVLWMHRRSSWARATFFAWAFFAVALVPVLGFTDVFFMRYSLVADHYEHISLIGVVAIVAAAWSHWAETLRSGSRWVAVVFAAAIVIILTTSTFSEASLYRDYVVLFEDLLQKNPMCSMAYSNLGIELAHRGDTQGALAQFRTLIRMDSADPEAHYNLANTLVRMNRLQEAVDEFNLAIQYKPNHAEAHNNLGSTLIQLGDPQAALEQYRKAVEIDPKYFKAYKNIGVTLLSLHEPAAAIEPFRRAAAIEPDNGEAHFLLGWALREAGQANEAVDEFRRTLELDPKFSKAYADLAIAYAQIQQPAEAISAARRGIDLATQQGQLPLAQEITAWLNQYERKQHDGR